MSTNLVNESVTLDETPFWKRQYRTTSRSIEAILHGNPQQAELAVVRLRRLPFIPEQNLEPLVQAYLNEQDPKRKELLGNSYRAITGDDIDRRIAIIND